MSKWEEQYNELKNGKLDEKLKELKELVDTKKATREEYSEYKKYSTIKENMRKVENVIEYRDYQKKKINEIDKILEKRKVSEELKNKLENNYKELKTSIIELEVEVNSLNMEKEELSKELKNKEISAEKRQEIMEKMVDIQNKIQDNNKRYVTKSKEFKEAKTALDNSNNTKEQFAEYSDEEINSTKMQLSQKISKCNMVARNLFEGRNWDYIDLKLDNWQERKFTSKTKLSNIAEPIKGKEETINNDFVKPKEELGLQEVSDWDVKHPKLAKIKNWFKSKFTNIIPKKEKNEVDNQENIENKDEDFKKFIKELAEKGMKQMENEKAKAEIEKDQKAKEEAKKRFENAKKEAHRRETEKFGKDYADKSVKSEGYEIGE